MAKVPICTHCNDTHQMWMEWKMVYWPCTHCPVPCRECGGYGAYCSHTPCFCSCHSDQPQPSQREKLGMEVRKVWVDWAKTQTDPKTSWLKPWEELTEPEKEVDRLIGERLFQLGRDSK
jgi:hypothetical protein